MDQQEKNERAYSRRALLRWASFALAGGVLLRLASGRQSSPQSGTRRQPPVFPKGSIFTPADDLRKDA